MLSKCANPRCSNRFLYFRDGKLFRWEGLQIVDHPLKKDPSKPHRKVEFFWLCGDCARHMIVVFKPGAGVSVRPIVRVHKAAS